MIALLIAKVTSNLQGSSRFSSRVAVFWVGNRDPTWGQGGVGDVGCHGCDAMMGDCPTLDIHHPWDESEQGGGGHLNLLHGKSPAILMVKLRAKWIRFMNIYDDSLFTSFINMYRLQS